MSNDTVLEILVRVERDFGTFFIVNALKQVRYQHKTYKDQTTNLFDSKSSTVFTAEFRFEGRQLYTATAAVHLVFLL